MVDSTREWDWMDNECRIHRDIEEALLEEMSGEVKGEGQGAVFSLERSEHAHILT